MMLSSYAKSPENESFIKWFGEYLVFCMIVLIFVFLIICARNSTQHYSPSYADLTSCISIIALPYIATNLIYSMIQVRMNLPRIFFKIFVSVCISLFHLRSTCEIKQFSDANLHIVLYSLAIFTVIMLIRDISRNISEALPVFIKRVLLVGSNEFLDKMQTLINSFDSPVQLAGILPYDTRDTANAENRIKGIFDAVKATKANIVAISLAERRGTFPLQEMLNCKFSGVDVLDAPGIYERITSKLLIEDINPSGFIFCNGFKITPLLLAAKRFADVIFSLLGLTLCLPFLPLVMLAIKLDSPGPALFRQERVGQGDRLFVLYKLRTMRQDAERRTGAVWAAAVDPRVTRLGRFLRKSRIDEIPQLINVLRGEMSLVGPRPERPEFVNKLKEIIPYYSARHFVKPGVTGWAQVCYPYGASVEDALEKLRYDMYYIKNISLLLDLRVIFKTIGVVLLRRGGR